MPAMYRHIRRRGLMSCCFESIGTSQRLTYPGAELQCHVCQAVLAVDQAGAWRWQEVTFLGDAPSAPYRSIGTSVSAERQIRPQDRRRRARTSTLRQPPDRYPAHHQAGGA